MRVSTVGQHMQSLASILKLNNDTARTQLEVSTGKSIFTAGDDPQGMARVLQIEGAIAEINQFAENAIVAEHRLSLEDQTLSETVNRLQRVNELAVQANNATQSNETLQIIGTELREIRDHLLQLANSGDGEGGYLFAGFKSQTTPFVSGSGGISYQGDQGQRLLQIGPTRHLADGDHGADVFLAIPNGNGSFATSADAANTGSGIVDGGSVIDATAYDGESYEIRFTTETAYDVLDGGGAVVSSGVYDGESETVAIGGVEVSITGAVAAGDSFQIERSRNQDLFTTLDNFIAAVETGATSPQSQAVLNNELNSVLGDIDQVFAHFTQLRTQVGSRLNAIDTQSETNAAYKIQLEATRSSIEDVDLVEAIARLDLQTISLEAASRAFVTVQSLSLFNFLR